MSNSEEITLGQLIDGTEDEFRYHIADKDLGYVKSLYTLLSSTYDQLVEMKDGLKSKFTKTYSPACIPTNEEVEIHNTIQGLFNKMLRVEMLSMILVEEIKKREMKD
jgi:hypothetical protein